MVADSPEWEVYRYASSNTVVGGFGKLFAHATKELEMSTVISYCDLRYGNGRVYKAVGFELDKIAPPDYWWVPKGKIQRIPRYQTQKHKLQTHPILKQFYAHDLSEHQICEAAGWARISGVGNQRWVWKLNT